MTYEFTVEDEGKPVVTADGVPVGEVHRVSATRAHVTPDPALADAVRDRFGWTDAADQVVELTTDQVAAVTDEEIRLAGTA